MGRFHPTHRPGVVVNHAWTQRSVCETSAGVARKAHDGDELCGLRSHHDHQDWLGRLQLCVTVVRCLAGQQTVVLAVKVFCRLNRTTGLDAVQHGPGAVTPGQSPSSGAVVTKDLRWAAHGARTPAAKRSERQCAARDY
jgi:hypothetical protein